jgi:hypothetical protein
MGSGFNCQQRHGLPDRRHTGALAVMTRDLPQQHALHMHRVTKLRLANALQVGCTLGPTSNAAAAAAESNVYARTKLKATLHTHACDRRAAEGATSHPSSAVCSQAQIHVYIDTHKNTHLCTGTHSTQDKATPRKGRSTDESSNSAVCSTQYWAPLPTNNLPTHPQCTSHQTPGATYAFPTRRLLLYKPSPLPNATHPTD